MIPVAGQHKIRKAAATTPVRTWALGAIAIVAAFIAMPFSSTVNVVALGLLIVAAAAAALRQPRSFATLNGLLVGAAIIWWLVLLANPNVISLEGGILGYRMSMVFFIAVLVGLCWPADRKPPLRLIWITLVASLIVSILIFWFAPGIEASISRAADEYTSSIGGSRRLQGLFAGPFHVALASTFLVLLALNPGSFLRTRRARALTLAVGALSLYLAQVRTAYVAVAVGIIVIFIFKARLPRSRIGIATFVIASLIGLSATPLLVELVLQIPAVESLTGALDDNRFTNRYATWTQAVTMIQDSPFFGWGPGSAGATLAPYFPSGGHVTSHSLWLKYGVEGGLLGLLLVALVFARFSTAAIRRGDPGGVMIPLLAAIITFSLTGSTLDTLPVSLSFGVLLGWGSRYPSMGKTDDAISHS